MMESWLLQVIIVISNPTSNPMGHVGAAKKSVELAHGCAVFFHRMLFLRLLSVPIWGTNNILLWYVESGWSVPQNRDCILPGKGRLINRTVHLRETLDRIFPKKAPFSFGSELARPSRSSFETSKRYLLIVQKRSLHPPLSELNGSFNGIKRARSYDRIEEQVRVALLGRFVPDWRGFSCEDLPNHCVSSAFFFSWILPYLFH